MDEVKTWDHRRKGRITGVDTTPDDPEWARIRMAGDQKIRLASRDGDPYYEDGDLLMVRRSLMVEVTA